MTISQLRYFLAVCKFGKIRIASERLHVSEPTISVSIKRLEEEIGAPLFIRSRKQLSLTEEGKFLQEKAAGVVEGFDRLEAEMRKPRKSMQTVRLGSPSTLSTHLCSPLIAEFTETYPSVFFENPILPPEEAVQQVENEAIELAICEQIVITSNQLVFAPLIRSELLGYVRADHPLAGKENVVPQMLKDEQLILLRKGGVISDEIRKWFHNGGVHPNFFFHSNRDILSVTLSMITRQNAMAFMLANLYTWKKGKESFPPAGIASFTITPPLSIDFGIIRKKGVKLSKNAQRFFDFCVQRCGTA